MALKGRPITIGATDTTIYTCPATIEASVHGLVVANTTGSSATLTLKVYVSATGATTTFASGITVAANSTFTWPKPINVNAGDIIYAVSGTASALIALYSVYEGSAAPAAVGFTPRGAWSSGASYAVNDVVSLSGSSYLAIQAGTNQNPSTQTAYWLVLASKGDTGATGATGSTGATGATGATGTAATISVGTVTTGAAGSSATVTNSGTSSAATLNFTIPRGDAGEVTSTATSSVDSEIALYSSTTGKVIKRASMTGLVYATSGVASAITNGTNGQVLTIASGVPSWAAASGGISTGKSVAMSMIFGF